jgi:uncharacterized BrkB/YihY/UPF0761 family membrane protein
VNVLKWLFLKLTNRPFSGPPFSKEKIFIQLYLGLFLTFSFIASLGRQIYLFLSNILSPLPETLQNHNTFNGIYCKTHFFLFFIFIHFFCPFSQYLNKH